MYIFNKVNEGQKQDFSRLVEYQVFLKPKLIDFELYLIRFQLKRQI